MVNGKDIIRYTQEDDRYRQEGDPRAGTPTDRERQPAFVAVLFGLVGVQLRSY